MAEVGVNAAQDEAPAEGETKEKIPASEYLIRIARKQVLQFFTDDTKAALPSILEGCFDALASAAGISGNSPGPRNEAANAN